MALSKLVSDFDIDDLLYILIAYIIGMLASALSGKAIFHIVGIEGGTNLYIVSSPLLAAVLEPILSKLAPAILIVYWMSKRREELLQPTQAHPFLIGAYGGACVGIVEAFGKLVTQSGMYAGVSTISTGIILAAIGPYCTVGSSEMRFIDGRRLDGGTTPPQRHYSLSYSTSLGMDTV